MGMTDLSWQQVSGAFARKYESARGLAWVSGPHYVHLADIAEWVNLQDGDNAEIVKRLLDNWFDTKWAMKVDYKPKFLAENLGSVYSPVAVPPSEEPNEEAINAQRIAQRRRENDRELHRKLEGHGETATAPPADLEAMLAGIGRKV